jgi:hypothetical protein
MADLWPDFKRAQGKRGIMKNKKRNLFQRPDDLRGTDIYDAIKMVRKKSEESKRDMSIKGIKYFALKLRRNYLITNEKVQDQILGDQFLDSPYFDFIAYVWDYRVFSPLEDYLELVNELIEAGYSVTKQ